MKIKIAFTVEGTKNKVKFEIAGTYEWLHDRLETFTLSHVVNDLQGSNEVSSELYHAEKAIELGNAYAGKFVTVTI